MDDVYGSRLLPPIFQNKQKEKRNFIALREESRVNGSMPIEFASVLVSQSVKEKFIFERTFVIGTVDVR